MERNLGLATTFQDSLLQFQKPQETGQSTQDNYPIVEMFHSVQGEGYWAGHNAFFIRLAGCDVGCPWCDTKESWSAKGYPVLNTAAIVAEVRGMCAPIAVITGGEPLMHNLDTLTEELQQAGIRTHLETSGTHTLSGTWDWVTLSPKRHRPPSEMTLRNCDELKAVITCQDDIDWAAGLDTGSIYHRYLQPEWETRAEVMPMIMAYVLHHSQWRVSLQTHKYMEVQ